MMDAIIKANVRLRGVDSEVKTIHVKDAESFDKVLRVVGLCIIGTKSITTQGCYSLADKFIRAVISLSPIQLIPLSEHGIDFVLEFNDVGGLISIFVDGVKTYQMSPAVGSAIKPADIDTPVEDIITLLSRVFNVGYSIDTWVSYPYRDPLLEPLTATAFIELPYIDPTDLLYQIHYKTIPKDIFGHDVGKDKLTLLKQVYEYHRGEHTVVYGMPAAQSVQDTDGYKRDIRIFSINALIGLAILVIVTHGLSQWLLNS